MFRKIALFASLFAALPALANNDFTTIDTTQLQIQTELFIEADINAQLREIVEDTQVFELVIDENSVLKGAERVANNSESQTSELIGD